MEHVYVELAGRIGLGNSERVARLFKMIADETEARILLAMPAQAAKIAEELGLPPAEVQEKIQGLFIKGLVFPSSKTDPPTYRMCRNLIQFHDATILWPEASQAFFDLWREFMEQEWSELVVTMSKNLPKPATRIIPVGVSIDPRARILDFESVKEIVHNASNLAVTKCTCRLSMNKCDSPLEVCLQVNRAADYTLARGTGRKVTRDEAMEILKTSEEQGLIHVTMNRNEVDHFICNCCPCCCYSLPVLIKGGAHVVDPSRFSAEINQEDCSGCGLCHDRCYFGAIDWSDGEGSVSRVDAEKCMGCGLCLVTCPDDAIELIEARPASFIPGAA